MGEFYMQNEGNVHENLLGVYVKHQEIEKHMLLVYMDLSYIIKFGTCKVFTIIVYHLKRLDIGQQQQMHSPPADG